MKCFEVFNFGPSLIQWIKTFYNDISSCVINNGYSSGYFSLKRGVRQGDPLSPYIFILGAEILSNVVRNEPSIKGIDLMNEVTKILHFTNITL